MVNLRKYGREPFRVAVIHGGPGAPGEMAPVARELSSVMGILEPLQTTATLEGQVREMKAVLAKNAALPVTLIGFSWGAWLSFIFAANYPDFVGKLILIGSGPFEEKYVAGIAETRLSRLGEEDRTEVKYLADTLDNPVAEEKNTVFAQLGALLSKADAYDPIPHESEVLDCRFDIFQGVWQDAAELRRSGKLLELGKRINCPVTAIHGDYDPHPAEGVEKPLSAVLRSFRFVLLKNCGHTPWIERQARDKFHEILREELRGGNLDIPAHEAR